MRVKTLSLFAFSILILALLVSSVGATSTVLNTGTLNISSVSVPASVPQDAGSFAVTFYITNLSSNTVNVDWSGSSAVGGNSNLTISPINNSPVITNSPVKVTATVNFNRTFDGIISGTIKAGSVGDNNVSTLTFSTTIQKTLPSEIISCINTGMPSDQDIRVRRISFTNQGLENAGNQTTNKFGDNNNWYPFETINAQIDVKNYGGYDTSNVVVSWGLWDTQAKDWVIAPTDENDFSLRHGDTKTLTVSFTLNNNMDINLQDLEDGSHYKFYVYVNGQVSDSNSVNDGADFCNYNYESPSITIENDFVVLTNIQMPQTIQCDQPITVSANVWNIGSNDQSGVSVETYDQNHVLNISQIKTVGSINSFDNQPVTFSFTVPKGSTDNKYYTLVMNVLDDNNNIFSSNSQDSTYSIPFQLQGNCALGPQTTISASPTSQAVAGKPITVQATILNNLNSQQSLTLDAAGYTSWASSATIDQPSIVLAPGSTQQVTITLNTNSDSQGTQQFYLEAVSPNGQVTRQPISVTIGSSGLFSGLTGAAVGASALLWGLGLLNVILIIIIVIVAIKLARK